MRKHIWLFLLFGMGCSPLFAQTVKVVEEPGGKPIPFVSIYSADLGMDVLTDEKGEADIRAFINAEKIRFSFTGYRALTYSFKELEELSFLVKMQESVVALENIVVSASRWEQSTREVPNKMASIKPQEVQFQNPQTAADMLEVSGRVFIQKSQLGGGSPMIRGFATNRVLLTVDGVRMNTAIFRSGNVQNVISLDPFSIENTEVIFGPGSTIYGSDAIGGVMSFYTLNPNFSANGKMEAHGSGTLRYSSANNEQTAHADVNLGWKKWAAVTSISYSDYDDLLMGTRGPEEYLRPTYVDRINGRDTVLQNLDPRRQKPSGYNQINLMQKIRFAPNEAWDFQYAFHYSETSPYPRYDRLIRPSGTGLRSAEWDYGPQIWMMNNLNISHSEGGNLYDRMILRLSYQHFEESRIDRNFNSSRRRIREEQVEAFSANLDFEKRVNGKSTLFYGLEALTNLVESKGKDENVNTGMIEPASTRYPDGSTWNSFALYGSYQYKASDRVNFQLSGRYNQVNLQAEFDTTFFPFPFSNAEINAGAFTGSVGMVYNPDEKTQIGVNGATGFRAPNIDDIGKVFDSSPGFVVVPNPNLKPEYSTNVDLSLARVLGPYFKVDATAFFNRLTNALVRRNFQLNGQDSLVYDGQMSRVQAIQNAAFAEVFGLQLGLDAEFPSGITLSSRYNWQKGTEELDDTSEAPLRHAPPSFGVTRLGYSKKQWRAEVYAMYNGEIAHENLAPEEQGKEFMYAIDDDGNPYSPAWWTLNIKAQWQMNETLAFNVGLENILNERYRPYSSGIVAPGRNFIFSMRAKF